MGSPNVLMRRLDDMSYPGYQLSICGNVWSDAFEYWLTPIPPKKSIQTRDGAGRPMVIRGLPGPFGRNIPVKTVRMMREMPDGSKERCQVSVGRLMARVVYKAMGREGFDRFELNYHGRKDDASLENLWCAPRAHSPLGSLAWDGRELLDRMRRDAEFRRRLGFRRVSVPIDPMILGPEQP